MNSQEIFSIALNLQLPWEIQSVRIEPVGKKRELYIDISYARGSKFPDETGALCSVHDTQKREWRHLNFFEHHCYLTCKVPRIKTTSGKVKQIEVPWARAGSGFTLLFEGYVMALIESEMPFNKVGDILGENPHRIWTIFNYWISRSYTRDQPSNVEKLGFDETSRRKGHDYITVALDLDERRVLHVVKGKDKAAIKAIKDYFVSKDVDPNHVKHASLDMSPSFIAGVRDYFPNAEIHFDRFHVVKLLNEAMDTVRKLERKEHEELKGHKYTFLKKKSRLSEKKAQQLEDLITLYPTLGEAYRLKELFNDLWEQETVEDAELFLKDWFEQVDKAGIEPFKKFVKTVKAHFSGITNFCVTQINNGILEGINGKIQLAKRRARGYRNSENFINVVYFLCGKLKFDYPQYSS